MGVKLGAEGPLRTWCYLMLILSHDTTKGANSPCPTVLAGHAWCQNGVGCQH
jgi:hypothetical protein